MTAVVSVPVATVWTAPDAPRALDAAATADQPDPRAWPSMLDTEQRPGLNGRTLTQGLLGEPVEVIGEAGDWAEVVLPWQPSRSDPRGYRGWMRRAHLGSSPSVPAGEEVVVTSPSTRTSSGLAVSYGTILPVLEERAEEIVVALPDGVRDGVPRADVEPRPSTPTADGLLVSARQFLGMAYLWGGTSGWGLDCSGYVHLVHRVAGLVVPRDASDQEPASRGRDLDAAAPGDLFFFARPGERPYHVGFVTSSGSGAPTMLHAPETAEAVRIEDAPLAPHRRATLTSAGTFLPDR